MGVGLDQVASIRGVERALAGLTVGISGGGWQQPKASRGNKGRALADSAKRYIDLNGGAALLSKLGVYLAAQMAELKAASPAWKGLKHHLENHGAFVVDEGARCGGEVVSTLPAAGARSEQVGPPPPRPPVDRAAPPRAGRPPAGRGAYRGRAHSSSHGPLGGGAPRSSGAGTRPDLAEF